MDYRLTKHVAEQATRKGFTIQQVCRAAADPQHTYPNRRFPSQRRHVREGLVVVVDTATRTVVTLYVDQQITPLREDQTDADALKFARKVRNRA